MCGTLARNAVAAPYVWIPSRGAIVVQCPSVALRHPGRHEQCDVNYIQVLEKVAFP